MFIHKAHEHPVCALAADHASKQHFHDDRYAPEDQCPLCAFWFPVPELPFTSMSLRPFTPAAGSEVEFAVDTPGFRTASATVRLRGPPVF